MKPWGLVEYYHLLYEAGSGQDPPAVQADGSWAVEIHPLGQELQHAEQIYCNNMIIIR